MAEETKIFMSDTLSLKILGEPYVVSQPNVGQLLEIEALKQGLSNRTYDQMRMSTLASTSFTADLIDALAYFTVLIPDFKKKHATVKSVTDLDAKTAKKIVSAFNKEFWPWYKILDDFLSSTEDDE